MRGISGFVFEALLPVLFAALFASGILVSFLKSCREGYQRVERPRARMTEVVRGIVSLVALLMFITLLLAATYSRFQLHYELWRLRSQDVQQIEIGNHRFSDGSSIEMIVKDLQSGEWYSVNHGGWGDETSMVLTMRSGTQWYMQAGYHLTQHGAVIRRSGGRRGSGWNFGQVFSVTLPETLEKLGVPLSRCDTVHGHPCATPPTPPKS